MKKKLEKFLLVAAGIGGLALLTKALNQKESKKETEDYWWIISADKDGKIRLHLSDDIKVIDTAEKDCITDDLVAAMGAIAENISKRKEGDSQV